MEKIWEYVKAFGRWMDRLLPAVMVDFMKAYPGLTVAAGAAVALFWGTIQRGLVVIGM